MTLFDGGEITPNEDLSVGSNEWCETSLSDLIDISHGFAFKGEYIFDEPQGGILLTPGNFAIGGGFKPDKFKCYYGPVSKEYVLSEGDLIVSMTDLSKQSDTLGYPAVVPKHQDGRRYLHNQRLGKIHVTDSDLESRYLYYAMCGNEYRHEVLASATGTTVKHTSPNRIRRFHFRLAPPFEQRAIAHVLGTLDDKIDLNRRMNETLEAMARALFKSWFIDFDTVRAKMEGRDPGLPRPLAALFPARLVDSELGKIPEGWKAGTLGEVAFLNSESWKPSRPPEAIRYVDLTSTKWGYIEHIEPYTWNDAPSRARRVLRKGDTIVSTVRPGNGSFALIDEEGLTGSTGFAVLRPNEATDRELVWCAATSSDNIDRLSLLADGGAYPAVPPGDVLSTPVAVAQPEVREAFSRLSDSLFDRIEEGKRESGNLAALRDALLPKLISGDLRLRNAESMVGAVA